MLTPDILQLPFASLADFTLEKNWSETQAEVRTSGLAQNKCGHRIAHYFKVHALQVKTVKSKPALLDVPAASFITPVKEGAQV
eukprot:228158-Amphidinium_carterae.1